MAWPNDVTKKDLRIDFFRAGGPGGQNVNKRDTACRITHIPTGISAQSSEQRSQHQNKRKAWERLTKKLIPLAKKELQPKVKTASPEEIGRVRTYHEPRQKVKDERLDMLSFSYNEVLHGNGLEEIIEELKKKSTGV